MDTDKLKEAAAKVTAEIDYDQLGETLAKAQKEQAPKAAPRTLRDRLTERTFLLTVAFLAVVAVGAWSGSLPVQEALDAGLGALAVFAANSGIKVWREGGGGP